MTDQTPISAADKARLRNLEQARKLLDAATAYMDALNRSNGSYTNAAARAEIPLLDAIYAVTECDEVFELAKERRDEVYGQASEPSYAPMWSDADKQRMFGSFR